ncbi:hypothetical protein ONZ43_g1885 [Nemania bipapillata]|uniref:Uncharacterized protein n=1 Tax=Nemania bipapillata TaxID=110536 RepID=A0ACC2J332_9PEZI|nr:hypothetical protein ONZ43_g1885 [Nemania bipapillata]
MTLYHLLLFVIAAWAAAISQGNGIVTDEPDLQIGFPADYSVGDIEWRGFEDFDDGQVFTGTIQNVIEQMRRIKGAHYTPGFMSMSDAENHALGTNPDHHLSNTTVQCGGPEADPRRIDQGIDYLNHLPNSSKCSNAAKTCGRISCSWNSAIWFCNDKTVPSNVYQCNMFGKYAKAIVDECAIYDRNPRVSGRDFDDGLDLSVVVKKTSC